jgi:hypothetical protein
MLAPVAVAECLSRVFPGGCLHRCVSLWHPCLCVCRLRDTTPRLCEHAAALCCFSWCCVVFFVVAVSKYCVCVCVWCVCASCFRVGWRGSYEALWEYAKASPLNKPAFVQRVFDTQLSTILDKEFLKAGAKAQHAGPGRAKL